MGQTRGSECRATEHAFTEGKCQWCGAPELGLVKRPSDFAAEFVPRDVAVNDRAKTLAHFMQQAEDGQAVARRLTTENEGLRAELGEAAAYIRAMESKCDRIVQKFKGVKKGLSMTDLARVTTGPAATDESPVRLQHASVVGLANPARVAELLYAPPIHGEYGSAQARWLLELRRACGWGELPPTLPAARVSGDKSITFGGPVPPLICCTMRLLTSVAPALGLVDATKVRGCMPDSVLAGSGARVNEHYLTHCSDVCSQCGFHWGLLVAPGTDVKDGRWMRLRA